MATSIYIRLAVSITVQKGYNQYNWNYNFEQRYIEQKISSPLWNINFSSSVESLRNYNIMWQILFYAKCFVIIVLS